MYCPQSWQFITFMFQHRCVSIVRDNQVTYGDYDGGGSVNQLRNDVFNAKFQLAYDFLRHALFFANQAILRNMSSLYIPGTSCSYYTKHWFDDTQWYFHYDTNCTMSSVINHKLIMTSPVYATHECLGEHFDVTMEHVFLLRTLHWHTLSFLLSLQELHLEINPLDFDDHGNFVNLSHLNYVQSNEKIICRFTSPNANCDTLDNKPFSDMFDGNRLLSSPHSRDFSPPLIGWVETTECANVKFVTYCKPGLTFVVYATPLNHLCRWWLACCDSNLIREADCVQWMHYWET